MIKIQAKTLCELGNLIKSYFSSGYKLKVRYFEAGFFVAELTNL